MKKTAYHKFLERIRHKILGEALQDIYNPEDPSRFQRLESICSDPKVRKRLDLLTCLYGLESKTQKEPFDTWLAMLWSGQARIRAPLWAVEMFQAIGDARLYDHDVKSLDQIFGFRAGTGETPPILKDLIHVRKDELFKAVWVLTLLDYNIKDACEMVAHRYQRDTAEKDKELPYRWRLGTGTKSGPGEYLRQHYDGWRKANVSFIKRAEQNWRAWLSTNREEYLQQFPAE